MQTFSAIPCRHRAICRLPSKPGSGQSELVDLDVRGIGDIGPFPCLARSQDAEGVSLTCQSGTGDDFVLRSRYLVACDGANSFVRKQLAIRLDDLAFDEWWMVVDAGI